MIADSQFVCEGNEVKDGRNCLKIVLTNNSFHYISYTIQDGEDLTSIAKRLYLNDFMIMDKNPTIDYYDDVKSGQIIQIPTSYAKKMVLYLDKEIMLPVQIDIFDDKGLYGAYSYNKLIINKQFAWDEFNTTFKDYHFR